MTGEICSSCQQLVLIGDGTIGEADALCRGRVLCINYRGGEDMEGKTYCHCGEEAVDGEECQLCGAPSCGECECPQHPLCACCEQPIEDPDNWGCVGDEGTDYASLVVSEILGRRPA